MLEKIRFHVYDILVDTEDDQRIDRVVAIALMLLILVNAVAVVLETVPELAEKYGGTFDAIEVVSVTIFTVEYLLRLWVAPLDAKFAGRFGRLRYAVSYFALIDLLAILPFFLPMVFGADLLFIRFLRVFRLFRLLKLSRYVESLTTLDDVVRNKREQLLVTLAMILMMLLFASSAMYLIEHEAQPDKFTSIPAAMWWGVATMTTVGYGDVFPVTPIGKLLGAFLALLGVGIFALPAGILASGFAEEVARRHAASGKCICPHCGTDVSDEFVKR